MNMRRFVPIAMLAAAVLASAEDAAPLFIRNAVIHPVTAGEITGSLLVKDGLIAGIGAKLAAPKGVKVLDAKGAHLYPGMIDSATVMGLTEISSVRETQDASELGDFNPQLRTIVAINPDSEHIPVARANGITSVITIPSGSIIGGQAALIHLDGWTWEDMAVSRSAAMHLIFPVLSGGGGRRGSSIAGPSRASFSETQRRYEEQKRKLGQFFEEARRYQKAKAAKPAGFKTDLKFEAMLPVLDRKLPVMVVASRERAIKDAIVFSEKENIRIVLAQVREPGATLGDLKSKNIPVILPETFALPLEEDDAYDSPFTLPNELFKSGVLFAFGTFDSSFVRNLPYQAANAVAFGLPQQEALKAVTINAARIWGVEDKIGSIEKGKWADFILTDGDPLETRTQIKQMFIRGREVNLENRHTRLYHRYLNRP
ncbi:MAG: amidohydrolase family protein [Acidobacteriia bacterium]|nr:amidohydrolase family protein [Terriglobia bacterium]